MVDFKGKFLNIGDKVIFISKGLCGSRQLDNGTIVSFEKGCAVIENKNKETQRLKGKSIYKL